MVNNIFCTAYVKRRNPQIWVLSHLYFFYRLDALPVAQPTVSRHRREIIAVYNEDVPRMHCNFLSPR